MIDEQEGLVREELEGERAGLLPDRIEMRRRKRRRRRGGGFVNTMPMICDPGDPLAHLNCPR